MKLKTYLSILLSFALLFAEAQPIQPDVEKVKGVTLTIQPVMHATMVLGYQNKTIYIDPTGGAEAFKGIAEPDLIIITDIHGDHFDPKTLAAINTSKALMVMPQAVADMMPETINKEKVIILKNGSKTSQLGIGIEAIAMYNLPEDAPNSRHTKGRGNGYILNIGNKNIYISGDTEAIPEMRNLKNIDIAFVCMNLPYTMDVAQAASGVLDFKPKIVYPYHYRGQDTEQFKTLVNNGNKNIDVRLRNWYPSTK